VREVFAQVFSGHDVDRIDDYFGEDYAHDGPIPPGRDSFKGHMRDLFDAFPDFEGRLDDVVVGDDKVVCRSVFRGTQEHELMGIAATGRTIEYGVIEIFRLAEGRIVEHWQQSDTLGLVPELTRNG
jgi:predicted ester cyclase